jgi:uncharacterized protein YndB with AHSA1/START domain
MSTPDSSADFTLTRSIASPRELVFQTLPETAHLHKWWGPPG